MLVYDGDCGFCTRCARWVGTRSHGVEVVPWQTLDLAALGLSEQQVRTAAYWLDDDTTDHYFVRAIFDNASTIVVGEDVKIAGAPVGVISDMDVTPDKQAAVHVRK